MASQHESLRALGLRCDRVALELLERLRSFSLPRVHAGSVLVVTVTAPIRLASRTAGVVEERIATALLDPAWSGRTSIRVHENRVLLTRLSVARGDDVRFVGFVHNPSTRPAQLVDLTERWLTGACA